jgi:hypothetical protein
MTGVRLRRLLAGHGLGVLGEVRARCAQLDRRARARARRSRACWRPPWAPPCAPRRGRGRGTPDSLRRPQWRRARAAPERRPRQRRPGRPDAAWPRAAGRVGGGGGSRGRAGRGRPAAAQRGGGGREGGAAGRRLLRLEPPRLRLLHQGLREGAAAARRAGLRAPALAGAWGLRRLVRLQRGYALRRT